MATRRLKGSERSALPNARAIGPADQHERLEVSVIVRPQARDVLEERISRLVRADRSAPPLSREDFAAAHGASTTDLAAVKAFAQLHGLSVVQEHAARRTVVLSGTVAQFSQAFGVELKCYEYPGGTYRGREGVIQIPEELEPIIEAVLGLDNRPQARPHFRIRPPRRRSRSKPLPSLPSTLARASAAAVSYRPTQLASLYDFPQQTARGECVAIIELGGGFRPQDLETYFAGLGVVAPAVTAVSVDHGANQPTGDPNGPDGEVMLDIEVVGAVAGGREHCGVFRAEHGCRVSGCGDDGHARRSPQTLGHLDQLGRSGVLMDRASDDRDGPGLPGRGGARHYSVCRIRRWRLERRRQRQRLARRLSGLQPLRTRLWWY